MKKYIKLGVLFITSLLLVLGLNTYAEDSNNDESSREIRKQEMEKVREERKNEFEKQREELKQQKEEAREKVKEERDIMRDDIKDIREEHRAEIDSLVNEVKEKRIEYKKELNLTKDEIKSKMVEVRAKFKEEIGKIKDEKKKVIAERIFTNIGDLNELITNKMYARVEQIENVLVSIESRITKAKNRGVDVSSVSDEIEKAKTAISTARASIKTQSEKTYDTTLTDEAKLKIEMQALRDKFKADIKAVNEKIKLAHIAVRDTAIALAQVSGIDDDEVEVEDEDNASGTPSNN